MGTGGGSAGSGSSGSYTSSGYGYGYGYGDLDLDLDASDGHPCLAGQDCRTFAAHAQRQSTIAMMPK